MLGWLDRRTEQSKIKAFGRWAYEDGLIQQPSHFSSVHSIYFPEKNRFSFLAYPDFLDHYPYIYTLLLANYQTEYLVYSAFYVLRSHSICPKVYIWPNVRRNSPFLKQLLRIYGSHRSSFYVTYAIQSLGHSIYNHCLHKTLIISKTHKDEWEFGWQTNLVIHQIFIESLLYMNGILQKK